MKAVLTGSYKAIAGAGAKTLWESEPQREPKQIGLAPQHRLEPMNKKFKGPLLIKETV
jgi:hypothetical protein